MWHHFSLEYFQVEEVDFLPPRGSKTLIKLILCPSSLPRRSQPLHQVLRGCKSSYPSKAWSSSAPEAKYGNGKPNCLSEA